MSRCKFNATSIEAQVLQPWVVHYATRDEEEAIAEAFAFYTSPDYKKGTFPKCLEDFVEDMIKSSSKPKESTSMDEYRNKSREGVEPIDDIYYVSIDDFKIHPEISWFDNKKGLVRFKTYEEKLRYALACYKVPEKWIERLIAEFPEHKWNGHDIGDIQYRYRETSESLEDLIAFYKKWFA